MTNIYAWSQTAADNDDSDSGITLRGNADSIRTADNNMRQIMAREKEWLDDHGGQVTVGGSADAITITANSSYASFSDGMVLWFVAGADNTGAATVDVNSVGALAIRKISSGSDVALAAGDIKNGQYHRLVYSAAANSAAGGWILTNPADAGGDVTGPASSTDGGLVLFNGTGGKTIKDAGYVPREVLTGNRTYYVRTDGNDSNNGLTDSSGGAFLTIQKAVDVIYGTLDLGGYTVTVSVADGTYTAGFRCNGPVPNGSLAFTGNTSTPANCHISLSSGTACVRASNAARFTIEGFKISNSASYGMYADGYSTISLSGGMDFGACSASQVHCTTNSTINLLQNYTISGNATNHFTINTFGTVNNYTKTMTLTGTPAFSGYFARVEFFGFLYAFGNTYTGSATGVRYISRGNGIIQTGGGATYLPGDSAGSTATQGQYL